MAYTLTPPLPPSVRKTMDEALALPDPLEIQPPLPDTSPLPLPDQTAPAIPQSSAPPSLLPAFGENPWDIQQREYQAQQNDWYRQAQDKVDRAALEPQKFYQDKDLSFFRDPEEAMKLTTNNLYLTMIQGGGPLPSGDLERRLLRFRAAHQFFGGRGADSEEAFNTEIVKDASRRKDNRELIQGNDDPQIQKKALAPRIIDAALEGKAWQSAYLDWQKESVSDPRYNPENFNDYMDAAESVHDRITEQIDAARPYAENALAALNNEKQHRGAYGGPDVINAILSAPEEMRPMVLQVLSRQALQAGNQQEKGGHGLQTFARGLSKQMLIGPSYNLEAGKIIKAEQVLNAMKPGDEFGGLYRSLAESAKGEVSDSTEGTLLATILEPFIKNNVATAESIAAAKAQIGKQKEAFKLAKQLEQIGQGQLDPLKADGWFGQKIGYPFLGSVAPSIASVVLTKRLTGSGAGAIYSMWGTMADDNAQQLMAQNPTMDFAQAYDIGRTAAYAQSGMEYAETLLSLGAAKSVGGALKTAQASSLTTLGKTATLGFFAQNLLEGMQDITPFVVQHFTPIAPDVDWQVVMNGTENGDPGYWQQRIDTMWALLPAIGMGSVSATVQAKLSLPQLEAAAEAAQDETLLKAAGLHEDTRQAIMAEVDPAARLSLLNASLKDADPQVAKEGQEEMETRMKAQETEARTAIQAGTVPTFTRTTNGWTVNDGQTGEMIGTAPDASGAFRISQAHSFALEDDRADRTAALFTLLELGDFSARSDNATRQTTTELWPGQIVTTSRQAAESEADEARIFAQQKARSGRTGLEEIVLGKSVTEFKGRIRSTVNRIHAGGSALTVFHEETHGFFREALATGRLTKDETLTAIRSIETVFTGRKTKNGETLRFLPENYNQLTETEQDTALDEAVSELMEAEVLRTRKGGGVRQIPGKVISRNLTAIARLAPGAAEKFGAFASAVREYFGVAFSRAVNLQKGLRDGTIDQDGYHDFLSQMLGLEADGKESKSPISDRISPDNQKPLGTTPEKMREHIQKAVDTARENAAAQPADRVHRVGSFWQLLGKVEGVLRFPKNIPGNTIPAMIESFQEIMPGLEADTIKQNSDQFTVIGTTTLDTRIPQDAPETVTAIKDQRGTAYLIEKGGYVWLDTSSAGGQDAYDSPASRAKGSVAAVSYQIAQLYAKRNHLEFIPDPNGLSEIARFRRWPQMLSSAIRTGDTSHMDASEEVGHWTHGKDIDSDTGILALQEYEYVKQFFPEIEHLQITADLNSFQHDDGTPVSRSTLDNLLTAGRHPSLTGIGETTLRRVIATRTATLEGSGLWERVSGSKGSQFGLYPGAIEALVSDRGSLDPGTGEGESETGRTSDDHPLQQGVQGSSRPMESGQWDATDPDHPLNGAAYSFGPTPRPIDPRIREIFGEFTADEYGLPPIPKTLPDDHPLLQETHGKATAHLPEDHILVITGQLPAGEISRKKLADAIIRHFLKKARPLNPGEQPIAYVSGGGGGAGKSTVLKELSKTGVIDIANAVHINADDIKELLPEFKQIQLKRDGRAAYVVHSESIAIADRMLAQMVKSKASERYHFVYDSTLSHPESTHDFFRRWKKAGYQIHLIGVVVDPLEGMIRASTRAHDSGRWVPNPILANAHENFLTHLPEYVDLVDAADIYDNTNKRAIEILKKSDTTQHLVIENPSLWNKLTQK